MANEITIRTNNREVSLVDIRRDFATFRRLKDYEEQDAITRISGVVLTAYQYRGQAANPADVNFIATNLYNELMMESTWGARHITLEEMSWCVKKAVLGGSEMYGISVASLYKVILEYCKGPGAEASRQARELNRREGQTINPALKAYQDVQAMRLLQTIKERNK